MRSEFMFNSIVHCIQCNGSSTYLNIHVSYYIKQDAVVMIDNWNAKKARKVSITCLLSQCCVINSVQVDEKIIPPPQKKKLDALMHIGVIPSKECIMKRFR